MKGGNQSILVGFGAMFGCTHCLIRTNSVLHSLVQVIILSRIGSSFDSRPWTLEVFVKSRKVPLSI